MHERKVMESKDVEAQKALLLLEREKSQLTEEVKLKLALANNLNEGMSNLERERKGRDPCCVQTRERLLRAAIGVI